MRLRSPLRYAVIPLACLGLAGSCEPPVCVPDATTTCLGEVSGVTVTPPPTGTVLAVGFDAQLAATATVVAGTGSAPTTFSWSATPSSVASVSGTGLVSGSGPGTATISASAGGMTGTLELLVVAANLAGIDALTSDQLFTSVLGDLDPATATALNADLAACDGHITSGDLVALDTCIQDALATSTAGGTDDVLFGVIELYLDLALDYVGLGS